jgi:hypothetical protein
MPRFHFHLEDGSSHEDDEGIELPDVEVAKAHAVRYFADVIKTPPSTFWSGDGWKLQVADESGLTLFSLHFMGFESPALGGTPNPAMITVEAKQEGGSPG